MHESLVDEFNVYEFVKGIGLYSETLYILIIQHHRFLDLFQFNVFIFITFNVYVYKRQMNIKEGEKSDFPTIPEMTMYIHLYHNLGST